MRTHTLQGTREQHPREMAEVNVLLNALQAVMEASRALWKWALEKTRLYALSVSSPT